MLSRADTSQWVRTTLADTLSPARSRGQAQETTRRLVAGSLVVLLLLVVVGYLVGERLAERQVLIDARHFSGLLANGLVGPQLTPELLQGDPKAIDEMDAVVGGQLVPRTSLRRVKVWSPDGRILYSDDRREIGEVFPLTSFQRTALRTGDSVAEVSDLSRKESALERALEPRLLEIYTGFLTADGRRVLIETYLSYEQLREQRTTVFTMLALLAGAGVVLFAGFQLAIGLVNLRWVRRRQEEVDERSRMATERARQRLARDLHDGPVQDLVGASYVVDGVLRVIRGRDLPDAERLLRGAATSVRGTIQSLRSVMVDLYPAQLSELGLEAALDDLAQPIRNRGVDVVFEMPSGFDERVSRETIEAIYRTVQESLRNVMYHARASSVHVVVEEVDHAVVIAITDNGIGMPPGDVGSPSGHLGLRALADIAREAHGHLEVWSAQGEGTSIRMELRT